MKIDGGCHCGAIAYEAEIDPDKVSICHCTDCQKITGTAFRVTVFAPESDFRILRGLPKEYLRTAESGNRRANGFCPDCGSQLYATSVGGGPKVYGIRLGTSRQFADLPPKRQTWHRSAMPWLPDFDGIATSEKQ
ncbi:MAG: GFA family protein [Rhizobiaceae bacterium]